MSNNTGGPAFPFIDSTSPLEHPGMTLRDYFAAKAMQTLLGQGHIARPNIPEIAYNMADAMLKAREASK